MIILLTFGFEQSTLYIMEQTNFYVPGYPHLRLYTNEEIVFKYDVFDM